MKVLVYTVSYGYPKPEYIKYTSEINSKYSEAHGYDYREFILPDDFPRHAAWGRVWFLKENLENYDYMLYIDGDAFVVDPSRSLDELISHMVGYPAACGLFAADEMLSNKTFHDTLPNAGVFLFSRENSGLDMATRWWDVPYSNIEGTIHDQDRYLDCKDSLYNHPYEQLALWFLWEKFSMNFRFTQSYTDLNGLDGTFIRHLMKMPDVYRTKLIKQYYNEL